MTGKMLTLLLLLAVPVLGACAESSAAADTPAPGTDARGVQFIGYDVYSLEGKWLGEVAGVLLDPETGVIDYLVLSYREPRVYGRAFMVTKPQRFIPIPWAQFAPVAGKDILGLDADEMSLIPAPYLEKVPDSLGAAQASAIDRYWQSMGGGN